MDRSGVACITSALADINAARAAEGVRPMVLPAGFASMSVPVQLLNLANLERVDRGLSPILGLAASLNRDAQAGAAQDTDPMPTNFYGDEATSNWAGGYDSTLEADFAWMYDDGLGSPNIDCSAADPSGCWGHRHDILWQFSAPIAMGAGYARGQYGASMTELFVGGDYETAPASPTLRWCARAPAQAGAAAAPGQEAAVPAVALRTETVAEATAGPVLATTVAGAGTSAAVTRRASATRAAPLSGTRSAAESSSRPAASAARRTPPLVGGLLGDLHHRRATLRAKSVKDPGRDEALPECLGVLH
ncbi:MAG: hypothetical protein JOZ25_00360 [Actinobacteria bacterium]|nr:hypothetical protein [Actinomycetota bacterium]